MSTLLKIAKSSTLSLLLSGLLIFAYTTEVEARKFKKSLAADVLPVTGQTIGGPGYYDSDPATQEIYVGPKEPGVCITVTNVGQNMVKTDFSPPTQFLYPPAETATSAASH